MTSSSCYVLYLYVNLKRQIQKLKLTPYLTRIRASRACAAVKPISVICCIAPSCKWFVAGWAAAVVVETVGFGSSTEVLFIIANSFCANTGTLFSAVDACKIGSRAVKHLACTSTFTLNSSKKKNLNFHSTQVLVFKFQLHWLTK